jgi:hypothetical protein
MGAMNVQNVTQLHKAYSQPLKPTVSFRSNSVVSQPDDTFEKQQKPETVDSLKQQLDETKKVLHIVCKLLVLCGVKPEKNEEKE